MMILSSQTTVPFLSLTILVVGVHGASIGFEDLSLAPNSFEDGANLSGSFSSDGAVFPNSFTDGGSFTFWSGFAYSSETGNTIAQADIDTGNFPPYEFESAAGGAAGGDIFALNFGGGTFELPAGLDTPISIDLTNNLYALGSMTFGDAFAKRFTNADQDFFKVTITGFDAGGSALGSTDFFLADFRGTASEIVDEWTTVDLTALGSGVREVGFSYESSDVGEFGINTPLYVAFDNVQVVPEPSAYAVMVGALVLGAALGRRKR